MYISIVSTFVMLHNEIVFSHQIIVRTQRESRRKAVQRNPPSWSHSFIQSLSPGPQSPLDHTPSPFLDHLPPSLLVSSLLATDYQVTTLLTTLLTTQRL